MEAGEISAIHDQSHCPPKLKGTSMEVLLREDARAKEGLARLALSRFQGPQHLLIRWTKLIELIFRSDEYEIENRAILPLNCNQPIALSLRTSIIVPNRRGADQISRAASHAIDANSFIVADLS